MTLKLHHLRPAPGAKTPKTRVGRGEASKGKTAGRGTKGTKARYQVPASFEGGQMPLHMRLPKLKGFKNPFKVEFQVVNLDRINALFPEGGTVGVEDLVAKGAVRSGQPVKVLGSGDISVALPPAAAIFSFAEAENACALTCTAEEISPLPSTLTGRPGRTAPRAARSSTPTVPPSGKSSLMRSRLTTWNSTLNGFLNPFSLGSRMWSGIWPPSKAAETW
jgi:large subunit ribosomal protein L15